MINLSLDSWWELLTSTQKVFWVIAIVFSALFLFQFVMSLFGLDSDSDADLGGDIDGDAEFGADHGEHGYSLDPSFTIFSLRGIISFFTFFGWTGVWLLNRGWSILPTVGLAFLSGAVAMTVVAYMIYQFSRLEKSGTQDIFSAVHEKGKVYLTIPAAGEGLGKVHLRLEGVYREFDAVSENVMINNGDSIEVVDILEGNILLVKPLKELPEGDID